MSARRAPGRPTTITPPVPPEIWLRILQLATDLPDDFDVQLWRLERPKKYAETFLRARLGTVRKLVRVCRLWHAFATPLLYETVWVSKLSRLELLLSTLLASQSTFEKDSNDSSPESPRTPLSACIKRVVITVFVPDSVALLPSIISLISLSSSSLISLHFLPHVVFNRDWSGPSHGIPPDLINALPSASLQVLNLCDNWPEMSVMEWRGVVESMVSLRAFRCDYIPPGYADLTSIYGLENMERICISPERSTSVPTDNRPSLPNVTELVYHHTPSDLLARPNLHALFPRFSDTLTRVTFSLNEGAIIPDFSPLSAFFPNLTRLDIRFSSWSPMFSFHVKQRLTLPPSVAHLGLTVREVHSYSCFINFCVFIVGEKLQVIQLLGRQTCIDFQSRCADVLKRATDILRDKGIRLLDWDENEMMEGVVN